MKYKGFIQLDRCILDDPVFQNNNQFKLLMYCLFKASYTSKQVPWNGAPVTLQAGEFIFGRNSAAAECAMRPSTVLGVMKRLKAEGYIDMKANKRYSIVSVKAFVGSVSKTAMIAQHTTEDATSDQQTSDTTNKVNNNSLSMEEYDVVLAVWNKNMSIKYEGSLEELVRTITQCGKDPRDVQVSITNLIAEVSRDDGQLSDWDLLTFISDDKGATRYLDATSAQMLKKVAL